MSKHCLDQLRDHLSRDRGARALDITHVVVSGGMGEAGLVDRLGPDDSLRLVLADPQAVVALSDRPMPAGLVLLEQAVLAPAAGPQVLHRTSFAPLDGLGAPAPALLRLFPGLRLLGDDPVEARDIATLPLPDPLPDPIDEAAGTEGRAAVLCLEAPGRALALLRRLAQCGALARLDALLLREGREPLYEGAAPLSDVAQMLTAEGFGLIPTQAWQGDPDRPWLLAAKPAIERLRQALAAARCALAQRPALSAGVEAELQAELKRLREALAKVQSERDDARQRLASMRDQLLRAEGQIDLLRDLLAADGTAT
ncbi:hypothetical protein KY389_09075 [Paracoccus bogoriensis]|uniref:hypothetical protein n=1 Tax=Paracoccus bogoriensis TaxID=242065 RepID=UPI001CA48670|nr:hypothetical protein [Paracoccus bogoriensis]MBW7056845.1 hypothetical protein [Paracoccus bogoriensis]